MGRDKEIVEANNVRMFHFLENGHFVQECRFIFLRQLFAIDTFNGVGNFGRRPMMAFADRGKCAGTKLCQ